MKKILNSILIILVLMFTSPKSQAQWVMIPDSNFVNFLTINFPGAMNGNLMDTTNVNIVNATHIQCSNYSILDLTGVQYFDNIDSLICNSNLITTLPILSNSIKYIDCSYNQISVLANLPSNLQILYCVQNQISLLPNLPASLTYLNCSNNQISTLSNLPNSINYLDCSANPGISILNLPSNLNFLFCQNNQLSTLPSLPNSLISLSCPNNLLSSLPTLPSNLYSLYCKNNLLTSLPNFPTSLDFIDCRNNLINILPAQLNNLQSLYCDNNLITTLPTLPNNIQTISCSVNQIQVLPMLPNSLKSLICNTNLLTSLPLLSDTLDMLDCSNNQINLIPILPQSLNILNCSNNQINMLPTFPQSLITLNCSNNPISCLPYLNDSLQINISNTNINCLPNYNTTINILPQILPVCDMYNNPNLCAFYWNIKGKVYFDSIPNCTLDASEIGVNLKKINLFQNGILVQQTFTYNQGEYNFDVPNYGIYTTSLDTNNLILDAPCNTNYSYFDTISAQDSLDSNIDFALQCSSNKTDVGIWTISRDSGGIIPTNYAIIKIVAGDLAQISNINCINNASGSITAVLSGQCKYIGMASGCLQPSMINNNTLIWVINDFNLIDPWKDLQIRIQIDTNATLGTIVSLAVNILTNGANYNIHNDTLIKQFLVSTSYDPNFKEVSPSTALAGFNDYLSYTIHFQNTGTDTAYHIFVLDTLSTLLDPSSLQLLDFSHKIITNINGNIVKFSFPYIYLVDSNTNESLSHGYVQFKIKLKQALAKNQSINNTASIYFDFNAPVQTNTSTFKEGYPLGILTSNINAEKLIVQPNPCNSMLYISSSQTLKNIILYNALGQQIICNNNKISENKMAMNVTSLKEGIYFIKATNTQGKVSIAKFCKN